MIMKDVVQMYSNVWTAAVRIRKSNLFQTKAAFFNYNGKHAQKNPKPFKTLSNF